MTTLDPIIAVKNVTASVDWYQQIFGFTRAHGGNEFAVLVSAEKEIVLCLHQWGAHEHPTMINADLPSGNGLLLYFRTRNLDAIYEQAKKRGCTMEEELHVNLNSGKQEFSIRDPDGYYLSITAFHRYDG